MKTKIKTTPLWLALIFLFSGLTAQEQTPLWTLQDASKIQSREIISRMAMPLKYDIYKLNRSTLQAILNQAPARELQMPSNTIVELPVANGKVHKFRIQEASILESDLQRKFPNIQSFIGQGIDDPSATARFSYSPLGLHVMISSVNHKTVYIDPYTKNTDHYICYSRNDLPVNDRAFECLTTSVGQRTPLSHTTIERNANDGKLRTFRLALACTGEYAQYHLSNQGVSPSASDAVKKAAVLSAMNTTMTRVNGIFERDLAVTMVLVSNNEDVIYLNGGTDPYTNNDGFAMLGQNQTALDVTIGSANYDIGHVFSTGGGGVAALNAPCASYKAEGVTGLGAPIGDPFDVDYVAHEMGHQYGANHTQNNNCQRSSVSVEPGSASTIMGYAGICSPNVQNNSDDYFNAINIQEMWSNLIFGNSTCAAQSDTNNTAPTANAGSDYTIPASTPFILRGAGSDPDAGNSLSYCWEQMDAQPAAMPPSSASTIGPAFRSVSPSSSPDRYMPALPTVLSGLTFSTWEVIPAVTRTMNFRLTVRDNVAGGASTDSDNVVINVDSSAGPFRVTSQDTAVDWGVGSTQTVTWNVANTNNAPVNCANVDILLSLDGGATFSQTIASGLPNNGSATITVPSVNTSQARIMVAGSNHLFYNVNSTNFIISGSLSVTDFGIENLDLWPNPAKDTFNVSFKTDANDPISISLFDLMGRRVQHTVYENLQSDSFEESVDIRGIQSGLYLVAIKKGNKQTVRRIIKQ